jgi:hypothetical protein
VTTEPQDVDDERVPIPRDHFGRPKILCPDGKVRTYTRVSTFAKALDDGSGLSEWKSQILMRGLTRRPHILADLMHIAEQPVWESSEAGARWQRDWKLGDYSSWIEEARDAGGGNEASRWGTALHGLAEWFDAESYMFPDDGTIPDDLMAALDRYVEITKDIEMLACEGFVVHDEWLLAGSYDRLGLLPDGRLVVMDIKTSPHQHNNVSAAAIQMAAYARGTHYNPDGTRDLGLLEHVDQTVGLIIQISRDGSGDRLLEVDLAEGWRRAELAREVRAKRIMKPRGIHTSAKDLPPF